MILLKFSRNVSSTPLRDWLLTGADDDGGGLVVNGHGAVVRGDGQPTPHLVQPAVHHGPVPAPAAAVGAVTRVASVTSMASMAAVNTVSVVRRVAVLAAVVRVHCRCKEKWSYFLVAQLLIQTILMVNIRQSAEITFEHTFTRSKLQHTTILSLVLLDCTVLSIRN